MPFAVSRLGRGAHGIVSVRPSAPRRRRNPRRKVRRVRGRLQDRAGGLGPGGRSGPKSSAAGRRLWRAPGRNHRRHFGARRLGPAAKAGPGSGGGGNPRWRADAAERDCMPMASTAPWGSGRPLDDVSHPSGALGSRWAVAVHRRRQPLLQRAATRLGAAAAPGHRRGLAWTQADRAGAQRLPARIQPARTTTADHGRDECVDRRERHGGGQTNR